MPPTPRPGGLVTDARPHTPYDFLRPATLPREHLRILRTTFEALAHQLSGRLTASLRVHCRGTLTSVEHGPYADHVAKLSEPAVFLPLRLEPLPGTAVLELPVTTAMTCLDHLLGGTGGAQAIRPLSEIETALLTDLLAGCRTELRAGLADLADVEPELGALESDATLVPAGDPSGAVVVGAIELRIGEAAGALRLCLPLRSLLPALRRLTERHTGSAGEHTARTTAHELLAAGLHEVPVDVSVRFDPIALPSTVLLGLGPGDVLRLGHPVDRPLDITTAGEVFGHAVATTRGTRLACQVVAAPDKELRR